MQMNDNKLRLFLGGLERSEGINVHRIFLDYALPLLTLNDSLNERRSLLETIHGSDKFNHEDS